MLYYLLSPLADKFILFNLFNYITFRGFLAGVLGFLLTVFLIPWYIRKFRNFREKIKEDVPESHRKKWGTPTAGGIVILFSLVVSTVLVAKVLNPFVLLVLFVAIYMGAMGFYDDYRKMTSSGKVDGISARMKILLQTILAFIIFFFMLKFFPQDVALKTQFLFFKNLWIPLGWLYVPFILFVFLGATNAVNLTDGLDGLAAGSSIPPLVAFTIVAYITGHAVLADYLNIFHFTPVGEISVVLSALIGSLLGFLWYNAHPAEIFMGDTGSQMIGGIFGISAILTKQEILLAIAGGVFVLEALSVILQVGYFKYTKKKYGEGRRIFLMAPLHHHFEKLGWPESKIVVRFWILSTIFSIIALATLKIR